MKDSHTRLGILVLSLATSFVLATSAGVAAGGGVKVPLDLPSGGLGVEDDEPEPYVISFFGRQYEGDAFVFVLDRSGSMAWSGPLGVPMVLLKRECREVIDSLSEESYLAMVAFHDSFMVWRPVLEEMHRGNRAAATSWVNALTAVGSTCVSPAVIRGLELAATRATDDRRVILVGDGEPTCASPEQTREDIAVANGGQIRIDTIFISHVDGGAGVTLFQDIASDNGGTFHVVQ